MLIHNSSAQTNVLFESTYDVVDSINKLVVTGYKLVVDKGDNFYSVLTGAFRYKLGRIRSNYHSLYLNTDVFNKEMVNKTAVFKNVEDIKLFFPKLSEYPQCCIVEMQISGDLKLVYGSNQYKKDVEMYIGNTIESIKKI